MVGRRISIVTGMRNLTLAIAAYVILAGCVTPAHRISKIHIGMTKEEVIALMGRPESTSAQASTEYLNYSLQEIHGIVPYYVRVLDGRVESYGRTGDFDSTKPPTVRIETDERIKADVGLQDSRDLYTELKKLKELKDSGIITEEEFIARKKKILDKY